MVGSAYVLALALSVVALMLLLYGLLQLLPGHFGNSLRRILFETCHPWLDAIERICPFRIGGRDLTAFLAAALLLAICRFGIPWLVLMGLAIKG